MPKSSLTGQIISSAYLKAVGLSHLDNVPGIASHPSILLFLLHLDKLHLTRLQNSLQLRPQFHHVDLATEQERASQKAQRELNNPTPARPQEARAVNLSVKPSEGKLGDRSMISGADQVARDLRNEEDEQWREIDWVDQDVRISLSKAPKALPKSPTSGYYIC